jgi:gas vesicle protein
MGEEPAAIREQIEQTRERMGETVEALGHKADVPSRAKESLAGKVDTFKARVSGAGSQVAEATPDGGEIKQGAKRAAGVAQENPLGLAIGATAVGFLAGMLIPSTRIEDQRLGPVAEQVKDQARQTGQEALEHGKQIVQETAETGSQKAQEAVAEIKDRVQESAQGHADELSDSAKESAEQARGAARDALSG